MIKKTLLFEKPAYLSLKDKQLLIKQQDESLLPDTVFTTKSLPIEDIGIVVLDNRQITLTQPLLDSFLDNNCALITCGESHMPTGMMLPLESNTIQSERFADQINASLPLKKQLWQQTVKQKILNQHAVLCLTHGKLFPYMTNLADKVKSGDTDNVEGTAAAYYWKNIFSGYIEDFVRDREGMSPNAALNYGYAILRAVIARSLAASGLLATLGIHHHNRYNAYCLADDIMEPYRPYVDYLIANLVASGVDCSKLSAEVKYKLLSIPVMDVMLNGEKKPLMIAAGLTASSLAKCFSGTSRKILYPEIL